MPYFRKVLSFFFLVLCTGAVCLAQSQPVDLTVEVGTSFRFAFFSDSRFTNPDNSRDSNASVRQTLVWAIADAHPAFVSVGGDIVYHGDDANDWKTWDAETAAWRENHIPVYPVLGNHELSGGKLALEQYFQRFPELKNSRYYSVRAGHTLLLVLDSALSEVSGPQGEWLVKKLDSLPSDVEFVLVLLHHPPYTSSTDEKEYGGGHSARSEEQKLGGMLEKRQAPIGARFVVFSGHVHNYERHEHGGITYLVSGGGGAHAYRIPRASGDLFKNNDINYHFLLVGVEPGRLNVTMNRVQLQNGKATWTTPDTAAISAPSVTHAKVAPAK
jgi:Icc-related predicted phosphoesterase